MNHNGVSSRQQIEKNITELINQYTSIQEQSYQAIDKRVSEVYKIRKKTLNTLQLTVVTYKNQLIIGDD